MPTVTVSDKGQVVIPAEIRRRLGITRGCQLEFRLEGNVICAELRRRTAPSHPDEGYGMLVCVRPGERRLADFNAARAMREAEDDRLCDQK
jgi:AbrB family looped-hinge helix DNA binding protein